MASNVDLLDLATARALSFFLSPGKRRRAMGKKRQNGDDGGDWPWSGG